MRRGRSASCSACSRPRRSRSRCRRAARRPPRLPPADPRRRRPHGGRRRSARSLATLLPGAASSSCSALAATLTGAGANFGLIAIQRTAGRMRARRDRAEARLQLARPRAGAAERRRAGARRHADRPGRLSRSRSPRLTAAAAGEPGVGARVPVEAPPPARPRSAARSSWDLLRDAGLARACCSSTGCSSSSWDVHSFLVPDPRPRARLQRLGDRPRARRVRDRGRRGPAR